MGLIDRDDGWRMPDWLREGVEPLLPPPPPHPLGTHRRRIPDRQVMNAILLVLRPGMQWNVLAATGICNSSSARRRFQEWECAGGCSTTTRRWASTRRGWPPTAP
jgi:transposase